MNDKPPSESTGVLWVTCQDTLALRSSGPFPDTEEGRKEADNHVEDLLDEYADQGPSTDTKYRRISVELVSEGVVTTVRETDSRVRVYPEDDGTLDDLDHKISSIVGRNAHYTRSAEDAVFLLEWMKCRGSCPALINDDQGHWTVSFDGRQTIRSICGEDEFWTIFFTPVEQLWHDTVVMAICWSVVTQYGGKEEEQGNV